MNPENKKLITSILKSEEFGLWNSFVKGHPEGTVFHTTTWLSLIGPQVTVLALWKEDAISAGVALLPTKKTGVKGFHIPPYTQYFSPLVSTDGKDENSLTEMHNSIKLLLESLPANGHTDFKLPRGHQSILPYHWKGFESSITLTHIISGSLESYLENLHKNKLRELKKLQALENAGEITITEEISETEMHQLLQQTAARRDFDAKATLVVNMVQNAEASIAKKFVIRSKTHGLLAFGFFPYDDKAVYNLVNASIRVEDPLLKTVNLLLLYQAIHFALTSGRTFDFEGSMLPGVETFCRLMGGKQVPVYRVQKSNSIKYSLLRAARQIRNDRKKT